jgi:hypothetical protein
VVEKRWQGELDSNGSCGSRLSLVLDEQFTVDDSESHNRYMYASVVVLLWGL